MTDQPDHKMQPLAEYMASPDSLTPQGIARRYADAEAAGVEIGTTDNPFPGMSPEEIADMRDFQMKLRQDRTNEFREAVRAVSNIKPGDVIEYRYGDFTQKALVTGMHYKSRSPEIWPILTRWQQLRRRITPRRWRKPLTPTRPHQPETFTLTTVPIDETPLERAARQADEMHRALTGLLKVEPAAPTRRLPSIWAAVTKLLTEGR